MKVGVALGGGGARGGALLGVLTELERLGLEPDLLTGTSIGGLVGAFYSAGLSVPEIGRFFTRLTPAAVFSIPGTSPLSLTAAHRFETLLEQAIGRPKFHELRLPLAVVAVDLHTRKEVILDDGDVVSAVLATTALPVVLPPVERGEHLLIDGGLLNNVPFDVARARGATHILAVDLSNTALYGAGNFPQTNSLMLRGLTAIAKTGIWQVGLNAIDIVTAQTFYSRLSIVRPEIVLRPEMGTIGLLDFHRLEEGVAAGQRSVREAEDDIRRAFAGRVRV